VREARERRVDRAWRGRRGRRKDTDLESRLLHVSHGGHFLCWGRKRKKKKERKTLLFSHRIHQIATQHHNTTQNNTTQHNTTQHNTRVSEWPGFSMDEEAEARARRERRERNRQERRALEEEIDRKEKEREERRRRRRLMQQEQEREQGQESQPERETPSRRESRRSTRQKERETETETEKQVIKSDIKTPTQQKAEKEGDSDSNSGSDCDKSLLSIVVTSSETPVSTVPHQGRDVSGVERGLAVVTQQESVVMSLVQEPQRNKSPGRNRKKLGPAGLRLQKQQDQQQQEGPLSDQSHERPRFSKSKFARSLSPSILSS